MDKEMEIKELFEYYKTIGQRGETDSNYILDDLYDELLLILNPNKNREAEVDEK